MSPQTGAFPCITLIHNPTEGPISCVVGRYHGRAYLVNRLSKSEFYAVSNRSGYNTVKMAGGWSFRDGNAENTVRH